MKDHLSSSLQRNTRREFLKRAGMAALPLSVGVSTPVIGQVAGGGSAQFIRVREKAEGTGWKYYRVKTAAGNFPARNEEEPFLPSQYGGDARVKWKATGKFRTEKVEGRWWLVDPDGHPFLSCGVNSVSPSSGKQVSEAVKAQGGELKWSKSAVGMLKERGFNTAGYWSKAAAGQVQSRHEGMPYVFYGFAKEGDKRMPDGGTAQGLLNAFAASLGVIRGSYPLFHPGFMEFCEERCEVVKEVKDDPWLLGYFTDNELRFLSLSRCLEMNEGDPLYGGAAREARRWWSERSNGREKTEKADNVAWMAHVFDWYFGVTTKAIRQYDPEHLQLGSRIYSVERNYPEVFAAAGRHLDVVSINPYGLAAVPMGQMREWSRWAENKPLLVGEFYVKGVDVGIANKRGAGLNVATQEERGLYYQNYVLNLLQSGVCVGWHWHRFADDEGFRGKAEMASNKGLVTADLVPYAELLDKMSELNLRLPEVVSRMKVM